MNRHFAIVSFLIAICARAHDAKTSASVEDSSGISPKLKPKSSDKFFGKDYPWDKRPPVDTFHFKHPYPVVQDSSDFDRDFVKDENSDDGSWKAQTEYDRLRHKLRKEKADIAKAFAAKEKAEKELQDALKREKIAKEKAALPPKKTGVVESQKGTESESTKVKKAQIPGGIANPGDVKIATDDTKRAMEALEECKKQLAEARERLKKLLKELEVAKKRQVETQETLDDALSKESGFEKESKMKAKTTNDEYKEYMDARTAYLQQQALLAKLEAQIKVAAEKVKKMRDAEDKGGGVYNTGDEKSAAMSLVSRTQGIMLVAVAAVVCMAY